MIKRYKIFGSGQFGKNGKSLCKRLLGFAKLIVFVKLK
jgi:hypothetical protein